MRFNYKNLPAKFQSFHNPLCSHQVSVLIKPNAEHREKTLSLNYQTLHSFYWKNKQESQI